MSYDMIIGFGVMGYLYLKLSILQGARVIVSETNDINFRKAVEAGAFRVVNPNTENLGSVVKELTEGHGCDVVFNTIPNASAWNDIFSVISSNSRVIVYSSQDSEEGVPVDFGQLHKNEYELIGSVSPTLEDNETAVRLISYGLINMEDIIEEIYNFEEGIKAVTCQSKIRF